jgi:FG-GAP repeat
VALSSDGNTALVGAPYQNNGTGAAYVFLHSGSNWLEAAKVTAADGASGDYFGTSVALNGNSTLLIGADGKNSGTGAAYVFAPLPYWGYGQVAELTASNGASHDEFGYAVALSSDGSTALIGAPFAHYNYGPGAGAAYAFVRNGSAWSQQPTLFASDGKSGDQFGTSVALNGNGTSALIGAPTKGYAGAAYMFVRGSTWSQQAELTASNGVLNDAFGYSVALSSNASTPLIGVPHHTYSTGAAYVF